MPNADQLERNAESHRAQLTDHISNLASSVNPEARAKRAVGQTADLGQTVVAAALDKAKNAPSGLALIGIGAALIALNSGQKREPGLTSYNEMGGARRPHCPRRPPNENTPEGKDRTVRKYAIRLDPAQICRQRLGQAVARGPRPRDGSASQGDRRAGKA